MRRASLFLGALLLMGGATALSARLAGGIPYQRVVGRSSVRLESDAAIPQLDLEQADSWT